MAFVMWVWLVKFYIQIIESLDNRGLDNRGCTVHARMKLIHVHIAEIQLVKHSEMA